MKAFSKPDYEDTFSIECPPRTLVIDVIRSLSSSTSTPRFVKVLMKLRNSLVSVFGLKTGDDDKLIDLSALKAGDRISVFEISELTDHAALIGADDSHLDFRAILKIEENILSCTTQVKFNNNLGRVYFFSIKPFHKLVVPALLKSSVKHLKRN
jgi:hypothetical protein